MLSNVFLCFVFLRRPFSRSSKGGLYIGVFRSSRASGDKDGQHQRSSEAQTSLGGSAWPGDHATWSRLAPGPHLVDSSPPSSSRGKILTLEKSQVNLSPGRSLKRQNTQNRVFCSAEL
jgi:hypothetical protein